LLLLLLLYTLPLRTMDRNCSVKEVQLGLIELLKIFLIVYAD